MSLIKNDVTDQDIENLFDKNDTTGFKDQDSEESLIPKELDVKNQEKVGFNRPESYQPTLAHERKQELKQQEASELVDKERLLHTSGTVSQEVFKEVAKVRQQAQLEEFIAKQRKLPKIASTARYKLWNDKPQCTFHVFQPSQMMDNGQILCSCKFCSQIKIFSISEWKNYELENRQYM